MKSNVRTTIKDLGLPTTGIYYRWHIGDKIDGKKIVAWWKPKRALMEDGNIYYLSNKPHRVKKGGSK